MVAIVDIEIVAEFRDIELGREAQNLWENLITISGTRVATGLYLLDPKSDLGRALFVAHVAADVEDVEIHPLVVCFGGIDFVSIDRIGAVELTIGRVFPVGDVDETGCILFVLHLEDIGRHGLIGSPAKEEESAPDGT